MTMLDAGVSSPYVAHVMNLLLLLSALLSALTGIAGGARPPVAAQAIEAQIAARPIAPLTVQKAVARPTAVRATPRDVAASNGGASIALLRSEPIFAARRRE